jgi:hypothetical protein
MHTQISSKLAALGVALVMNSLLIGGVSQLQQPRRAACNGGGSRARAVALCRPGGVRWSSQLESTSQFVSTVRSSSKKPPIFLARSTKWISRIQ